jgi:hypothetical protein
MLPYAQETARARDRVAARLDERTAHSADPNPGGASAFWRLTGWNQREEGRIWDAEMRNLEERVVARLNAQGRSPCPRLVPRDILPVPISRLLRCQCRTGRGRMAVKRSSRLSWPAYWPSLSAVGWRGLKLASLGSRQRWRAQPTRSLRCSPRQRAIHCLSSLSRPHRLPQHRNPYRFRSVFRR